jgi:hypothetical protein
MTLPQLLDSRNTFFHAEVSCATLVIFRIAIGCLLIFFTCFSDANGGLSVEAYVC